MQEKIRELVFTLSQFDQYTVWTAVFFVAIAYALIREILQSATLALVSVPILMVGALAANYLFTVNLLIPTNDKDANVAVASAVGVIAALTLLLLALWISVLRSERRTDKKKLKPLIDLPPSGE